MKKIFQSQKFYIVSSILGIIILLSFIINLKYSHAELPPNVIFAQNADENEVLYLSDINYSKAQVGWGNITFDKTQSNTPLTLILNGYSTIFKKGIWAHATSTIEYDISEYKDFKYFTTYYGLNTTAQNTGNGVKFYIYTSIDGQEWTLQTSENPPAMKGVNNAAHVKIDISNVNYIKLYAYDNGSNASDHAVWADTKLVKEGYNENVMIPVEEFDEFIKSKYTSGPISDDLKLPLLQRDFINSVGQYQLKTFLENDPKNKETLDWFINNEEALRLWTVGGNPNGSFVNALQVLSNLYHAHKDDLQNENVTENGVKYKDLYLKMMLALSLTHSSNIGLWIGGNQFSDAVTRYEIYKEMHLNKQLLSSSMFESYTVEEMRWLMHVNIDDEEIKWLHDYSLKKYPNTNDRFNPYKYITYRTGYSYYRPQYYSAENYSKWDQKYNLSAYNITYQSGKPKLWIVFEEGAVCGGLSKTAANLYGVWGIPASVVGQPAHAAYIYYYNVGGKGAWQLAYNVAATAWANTQGYSRMPNDWGNFSSGVVTNTGTIKSASYFFLSQEAQNEYEKYEKAELIMLLENVYKDNPAKLEQIYRDTLEEEIIHWEAWLGLVNLYIKDETKSEADLIELAEEISEVLTYHPLPMYDLTRRIGTKITSPEYRGRLMLLQNKTLREATKATASNSLQYKEVPVVAQALLGEINSEIASFSFTGTNARKIVLSKQLQSSQVNWSYSLDGGKTWKDCFEHSIELTQEEINSITVDNDIKIHISGLPLTDANIYTINITKRTFPTGVISINDEEDRMIGATNEMEWTLDPKDGWNSFANTNPIFSGNKRVYVRIIAAGTQIASDPVYYTFTENNSDDTKWYIQSKNLSVFEVNATQTGNKDNILDGDINTYWRSKHGIMPAYVTIKLDQPRYISGLDYVPDKNAKYIGFIPYGRARNVKIYVSMDNKNWELAATKTNLGNNDSLKHIDFPEAKKGLYVKFECESVYEGDYLTLAVSVIKLYENVIVNETPRAEVNYNIIRPTNKNVVAELVNFTRPVTVTNNNGKTSYTFTENGEFTFEFVDEDGNRGSTRAYVDWIDKEPPKATVVFSTMEVTNEDVVATLTFDKKVTILSKDVEVVENPVDKSQTITFLKNDSFKLEFMDELGNIGTETIAVNWIDKVAPTAEFEYSTTHLTDKPVTAKLQPSEEVTILNNDGKDIYTFDDNGEFTFEFVDAAGNIGSATANVSWIARMPKYNLKYTPSTLTNQNVDVVLEIEDGYRVISNNGSKNYTFTENGSFDFQYADNNGNVGFITASVDWIDKVAPTAEFEYTPATLTDQPVTAKLQPSEEVTILNNAGKDVYTFNDNGEFTFEFVDKVGNKGSATAKVTWITKLPKHTFKYNPSTLTNKDVEVVLEIEDGYKIISNNGNNTYTFTENGSFDFQYVDTNGNIGYVTAVVDWIDKIAPTAELSYVKENGKVIVQVINPSEEITFQTGNGIYEFTEVAQFDIYFYDKAGNEGKLTAIIDSIPDGNEDNKPNPNPDNPKPPVVDNPTDKPTTPNPPNQSGNNKPNQPNGSNPSTSNQPSIPNKPNVPDTPSTDTPVTPAAGYKKYALNNVKVEVPKNLINDTTMLRVERFLTPEELKDKVGKVSEYFDIYLASNDFEKLNIISEELLKISFKINETKKIRGIYEINDDNTLTAVDFTINGSDIEIKAKDLGKYVISYDVLSNWSPVANSKPETDQKYYTILTIVCSLVIVLGTSIYLLKQKA